MNKEPLVTVITPSFNQGKYIEETIKSVLNQTYGNIEYIVMDGGSTDNTVEVLKKYEGRIKFFSEKDKGQTDAINKGFKMAKGEIVGWINSDDILESEAIKLSVEEFVKNDKLAITYGNIMYIDENGVAKTDIKMQRKPVINMDKLLHKNPDVIQAGSFYSYKLVKQVGYLDESLNYVMDYDLFLKLLKIGEIKFIDRLLAKFRLHDESKTVSQTLNFSSEIYKVMKKYNVEPEAVSNRYMKEKDYKYWHNKMEKFIDRLFGSNLSDNIGLYGAGGHTEYLLNLYKEIKGDINRNIFIIDSKQDLKGKKLMNFNIYTPEEIPKLNLHNIIISSFTYQEEIYDKIKIYERYGIKITKIYEEDSKPFFD
ncbi:glycosyltransferase [Clostridium felsineum]|uniref:glycosyltransferase family 2 protein n=1 Tax=Clostridium felsineum TaxID=36839 RepID=UPI00214DBB8B|nr:glycosyltransferase family 2 protein [Clostridium felsineum]MCR3757810.1 glycosyltransferase [Clostridium felsineum]